MRADVIDRIRDKLYQRFRRRTVDVRLPRPMVSFTFDDFPKSALLHGGEVLSRSGFRGTYYLAGALAGKHNDCGAIVDAADLARCVDAGHEIGNHTLDHADLRRVGSAALARQIVDNGQRFADLMTRNLAYPFGSNDVRVQRIAASLCESGRGIGAGINAAGTDLFNLRANKVYSESGLDLPLDLLAQNGHVGGWLIFYTHDVADVPSPFGCTVREFGRLVEAVAASGSDVVTIQQGLRRVTGR